MFTLHGSYGSASFPPQVIPEMTRQTYQIVDIDLESARTQEYLALNPTGRVPTLIEDVDGEVSVMTESSAMCIYLADRFPELKLSPELTEVNRKYYLQWMAFLSTSLQ